MEITINKLITDVEKQWLSLLYHHCRQTFEGTFLPSHDHYHHYRVWHFARQVFAALDQAGRPVSALKIEQTIIAVFFHDLGLTVTLDEAHGRAGRELCREFFRKNKLTPPVGFEEILDAIEKHDEKKVMQKTVTGLKDEHNLLNILSACDDMDAFGYTGVYRYAEIYLLRGIPAGELAGRVLPNLENRYLSLSGIFSELEAFTRQHKERFSITRDFYAGLEEETDNSTCDQHRNLIIEYIREKIQARENLLVPGTEKTTHEENEKINEFLNLLRQEVSSFPYP